MPEPEVQGPNSVAAEVHATRFEPGWPPPPGAGDIHGDPPLEEVSEEVDDSDPPEPGAISPDMPPSHRTGTRSPGTLRKVTRAASFEVHPQGRQHASVSLSVEQMSLEQLQVQARMLTHASLDGLNRGRVEAILEKVRNIGPFDLHLVQSPGVEHACAISSLLAAVLKKAAVPWLRCRCEIQ